MKISIPAINLDEDYGKGNFSIRADAFAYSNESPADRGNPTYFIFFEKLPSKKEDAAAAFLDKHFSIPKNIAAMKHDSKLDENSALFFFRDGNLSLHHLSTLYNNIMLNDLSMSNLDIIFVEHGQYRTFSGGRLLVPAEPKKLRDYHNLFIKGNKNLLDVIGVTIEK